MANRIVLNNISYHGKGAIQEIVNEVKTNGYQHLFVATDPDLLKFGVTAKVTDILDNAGIAYTVYSKIKPNPTIQNVQEGVAAFQACGADAIVAIGGGSSMDTAKAIGIIITNPEFPRLPLWYSPRWRESAHPYQLRRSVPLAWRTSYPGQQWQLPGYRWYPRRRTYAVFPHR